MKIILQFASFFTCFISFTGSFLLNFLSQRHSSRCSYLDFRRCAIYEPPKGLTTPKWFRDPVLGVIPSSLSINSSSVKELAIFPFDDGNCLPTGNMPLHIFVMKYRQMMNEIHAKSDDAGLFGMVMSTPKGGLCETGCSLQNVFRKLLDDGRQYCLNEARERFRIIEIVREEPYIIAKVEYGLSDDDTGGELSEAILSLEREVWQAIQDVVNLNNRILEKIGEKVELSVQVVEFSPRYRPSLVERSACVTPFSFAVSDMLDLTSQERQLLLDCRSVEARLRSIRKFLVTLREDLMAKAAALDDEAFN